MKLDDIDKLNYARTEYLARKGMLQRLCSMQEHPGISLGNHLYVKDADILLKVKSLLVGEVQKKHDEAKTKLMMLGIDEFPE